MIAMTPEDWYQKALDVSRAGDPMSALTLLESGLATHPRSALLAHAAGSLWMMQARPEKASELFGKAFANDPKVFSHAVDQAVALAMQGRHSAALSALAKVEKRGANDSYYCTTRAEAERGAGRGAQAVKWFDRALKLEPERLKALVGRASVALERGEKNALDRFELARAREPHNPLIQIGIAQSLEMDGDFDGAMRVLDQITNAFPDFTEALRLKAQLRCARGDDDFASHFADAAAKLPQLSSIRTSWCLALAGMDCEAKAADIAAQARKAFPDEPQFALLEAIYAGAAGDQDRAEAIWGTEAVVGNDRDIHEARHRIRQGQFDRAEALLTRAIEQQPNSIDAWSLRGILWRVTDDPRADWLHEQARMVELLPLGSRAGLIDKAIAALRDLHAASTTQLGQALRRGTQTRGNLFQRADPAIGELYEAARKTLQRYRAALPAADTAHPLLRHRDSAWRITGSWSIRINGAGGHHRPHIHPEGIVSSALYLVVPDEVAKGGQRGWLELGRPPADLGLNLSPLKMIEPQVGHLALFPSTLYHETTPFEAAERMTVAFDVAAVPR